MKTRQITKHVTNLLKNHYHDTEVYAIRAGVVSGIRSKFELYKNRSVNDYHHAHDAYLAAVLGEYTFKIRATSTAFPQFFGEKLCTLIINTKPTPPAPSPSVNNSN